MQDSQLELTITNKNELLVAYMPFVKNGGIFVPTKNTFLLGQMVNVTLKLWCLTEPVNISGKVIWITPLHAQSGRPAGIGVQIVQDNNTRVKDVIEKQLAGLLQTEQHTNTI
jgi:type IV pilus assembly protein PilZ